MQITQETTVANMMLLLLRFCKNKLMKTMITLSVHVFFSDETIFHAPVKVNRHNGHRHNGHIFEKMEGGALVKEPTCCVRESKG